MFIFFLMVSVDGAAAGWQTAKVHGAFFGEAFLIHAK